MTQIDADGAPLMRVWGSAGPPRHADGSVVVTARLAARLTPLELAVYTGSEMQSHLARRVWWLTDGEPIDGWYPEDFVGYGLALLASYPEASRHAVSTWVRQEVDRRRRKVERAPVEELPVDFDPEAPAHRSIVLPERIHAALSEHLRPTVQLAVRLYAEQGLTVSEACDTVGVHRKEFYRALQTLRGQL